MTDAALRKSALVAIDQLHQSIGTLTDCLPEDMRQKFAEPLAQLDGMRESLANPSASDFQREADAVIQAAKAALKPAPVTTISSTTKPKRPSGLF